MEFEGKVFDIKNYLVNGIVVAQIIKLNINNEFKFNPGQYAMLSESGYKLRSNPTELKWTSYSITSLPRDIGILEFVYTVRKSGGFTQYISENLKIGSILRIKGPYGTFTLMENDKEKIFVATGAGIAPIMSMIRTLVSDGNKATLFYGFRTGGHFLYREELEKLAKDSKINLIATSSRKDPLWKGRKGYVTDHLKLSEFDPEKQEVYICGNPNMVKDVCKLLLEKGFSTESIRMEQW